LSRANPLLAANCRHSLGWLQEGVVMKGKKRSWTQLRHASQDLYVGLTRLNNLKVGEVKAAL
jgi:hypothetical protein